MGFGYFGTGRGDERGERGEGRGERGRMGEWNRWGLDGWMECVRGRKAKAKAKG